MLQEITWTNTLRVRECAPFAQAHCDWSTGGVGLGETVSVKEVEFSPTDGFVEHLHGVQGL